jgi:hypothetical protein
MNMTLQHYPVTVRRAERALCGITLKSDCVTGKSVPSGNQVGVNLRDVNSAPDLRMEAGFSFWAGHSIATDPVDRAIVDNCDSYRITTPGTQQGKARGEHA